MPRIRHGKDNSGNKGRTIINRLRSGARKYQPQNYLPLTLYCLLAYTVTAWAGEFQVGMKGWEFHPAVLTIQEGDTVIWINDDEDPHNVKFEDPSLKGSEERIKPGKRFTVTFEKSGEYNYYCKIHVDQGMKGRIVVGNIKNQNL